MSVIVLEMGGSSDLCAVLKPGEPVVLMGPTGTPTEIHAGTTVALVGGGLGNAVLFSIGAALRAAGSRVIYFAGYKQMRDRYKVAEIERAADVIVWCCDEAPGFAPTASAGSQLRRQHRAGDGGLWRPAQLGEQAVPLAEADHMIVIGSDRMMQAVGAARHGVLAPYLKPGHTAIGSINSPMQCMMKEVCAQCLQPQIDPVTGERTVVFSCFNQDQALDRVDFPALHERLAQNGAQEKLTAQWIDRALRRLHARGAAAEPAESLRCPPYAPWRPQGGLAERIPPSRLLLPRRCRRAAGAEALAFVGIAAECIAEPGPPAGIIWPRISPPLLAAVWTFTYHLPACRSAICASVSVTGPGDRAGRIGADRHHHAGIRPGAPGHGSAPPSPGRSGRNRSSCNSAVLLLVSSVASMSPQPFEVVGGTSDLPAMRCMEVDHGGRGG